MTILDTIIAHKRKEIEACRAQRPMQVLERSPFLAARPIPLSEFLLNRSLTGIIAEFKRRSPSRGTINATASPAQVCSGYALAGASALSVLTDAEFFGGSNADLSMARIATAIPILRKDFIVDEYQVVEARSMGADAILLIAEVLSAPAMRALYGVATRLGMEVLFEVHHGDNIGKLPPDAQLVGINSRNLSDFRVDPEHSARLLGMLPPGVIRVAESGIESPARLIELRGMGFEGFLIGERFMREEHPARAFAQFVEQVKRLQDDH